MHLLQSVSLYDPARHLSPTPHPPTRRRTLQKSLSKLCLSLLVEQSPLLGAGIAMATITESLNPLRFVTPFDLFSPLLRVAYHLGHLANRITNRHAPDHQQVSTQHRIGSLAVKALKTLGLRLLLRISFLAHARKYTAGFGITRNEQESCSSPLVGSLFSLQIP